MPAALASSGSLLRNIASGNHAAEWTNDPAKGGNAEGDGAVTASGDGVLWLAGSATATPTPPTL